MTQELPPLPEPAHGFYGAPMFTADQMRAYALQAIAARADAQPVAPITAREVAAQVFALCEHIEGKPDSSADSFGLERFTAGERFAAKTIRHGIGTWLTDEENTRAAAPAPRQPLSEEQVFASQDLMHLNGMMLRLSMTNLMQVVRAIERAHGITEDTCPKT